MGGITLTDWLIVDGVGHFVICRLPFKQILLLAISTFPTNRKKLVHTTSPQTLVADYYYSVIGNSVYVPNVTTSIDLCFLEICSACV